MTFPGGDLLSPLKHRLYSGQDGIWYKAWFGVKAPAWPSRLRPGSQSPGEGCAPDQNLLFLFHGIHPKDNFFFPFLGCLGEILER